MNSEQRLYLIFMIIFYEYIISYTVILIVLKLHKLSNIDRFPKLYKCILVHTYELFGMMVELIFKF